MDNTILLRFLNHGLIDVGGDDSKLEKLTQAAGDLAGVLGQTPSKALSFSLIAFDPDAPEDDPVVVEALAALKSRWTTYRNTFSSAPVFVIRAILLDALVQASKADDRIGVCLAASARNVLPLMRAGDEQEIWADVVADIEKQVDARAEREWTTPSAIMVPAMSFDAPTVGVPSLTLGEVDQEALLQGLYAAGGPSYFDPQRGGGVTTSGNQHNPANNPAHWTGEFGRRATDAISQAINDTIANARVDLPDLAGPLKTFAEDVSSYVDDTLKVVSAATVGLQRRTNLLWWKEALFSPSARKSYRELSLSVAAAQMAFDLSNEVPLFSPASVACFLGEAVLRLAECDAGAKRAVRDLVSEAQVDPALAPLRDAAADLVAAPTGRGPLLALIGHPDRSSARSPTAFQALTGVSAEAGLDAVSWAGWIFTASREGRIRWICFKGRRRKG